MIRRRLVGVWFLVAVAAIGAALADRIVEGLANNGVFGPSEFTDRSYAANLPVACVGAGFLLRFLYLRVRNALRAQPRPVSRPDGGIRDLGARALVLRLPIVLALQIAALWAMETAEQHIVCGHAFGGTVWVGGPTAISLLVHAAVCLVTTFTAQSVLRALEPRAVRFIRALMAVLCTLGDVRHRIFITTRIAPVVVRPAFVLCRIGERAPPLTVS